MTLTSRSNTAVLNGYKRDLSATFQLNLHSDVLSRHRCVCLTRRQYVAYCAAPRHAACRRFTGWTRSLLCSMHNVSPIAGALKPMPPVYLKDCALAECISVNQSTCTIRHQRHGFTCHNELHFSCKWTIYSLQHRRRPLTKHIYLHFL